jgi:hypothetical protein
MAVPALALSAAKVTSPSGIAYDRVQIAAVIPEDGSPSYVALSEQNGTSLGTRSGVVSIDPDMASNGWLVRFVTGEVWTVTRTRGCNCGGR